MAANQRIEQLVIFELVNVLGCSEIPLNAIDILDFSIGDNHVAVGDIICLVPFFNETLYVARSEGAI
jgi:hypothetical protein